MHYALWAAEWSTFNVNHRYSAVRPSEVLSDVRTVKTAIDTSDPPASHHYDLAFKLEGEEKISISETAENLAYHPLEAFARSSGNGQITHSVEEALVIELVSEETERKCPSS